MMTASREEFIVKTACLRRHRPVGPRAPRGDGQGPCVPVRVSAAAAVRVPIVPIVPITAERHGVDPGRGHAPGSGVRLNPAWLATRIYWRPMTSAVR